MFGKHFIKLALLTLITLHLPGISAARNAAPVQVTSPVRATEPLQRMFIGTITSQRRASISPRVNGLIKSINCDVGCTVKKGDPLIELDSAIAYLEKEQAKANLEQAKLKLLEFERLKDEGLALLDTRSMSKTLVDTRISQVKIQRTEVNRLKTELAMVQEQLRRHKVFAPFDGIVVNKFSEVGEWAETGTASLELIDVHHLYLDIQVPQLLYGDITVGQAVTFDLDATSEALEKSVQGSIAAKVPLADSHARTFLARIQFEPSTTMAIPGMSAQASFLFPPETETLRLSNDAITRYPDGTTTVWVIREKEEGLFAHEKKVLVVNSSDGNALISEGVDPEDRVVVRGNESLREGQQVRIIQKLISGQPDSGQGD